MRSDGPEPDDPLAAAIFRLAGKPYRLASMAGCTDPDDGGPHAGRWSPGAAWLSDVAEDVMEAAERGRLTEDDDGMRDDAMHEIADAAVPTYTHELWAVFTDLSAWQQEDAYDHGAWESNDPTHGASMALYFLARRLVEELASVDPESD